MVKHSPGKARQLVVVKVPAAPQPHTHATGGRHQRNAVLGASCAQKTAYQTINSAHKMKTAHGDWLYSGQASRVISQGLKARQLVKHSPGKALQLVGAEMPAGAYVVLHTTSRQQQRPMQRSLFITLAGPEHSLRFFRPLRTESGVH